MIRVMSEVKSQEDEYDLIKDLCTQIHGLHMSSRFARRDRRLLIEGPLLQQHIVPKIKSSSTYSSIHDDWISCARDLVSSSRNSRLATTLTNWDQLNSQLDDGNINDSISDDLGGIQNRAVEKSSPTHAIQVFVFSDIILFTRATKKRTSDFVRWQLEPKIGVSRILSVTHAAVESRGAMIFMLDLIAATLTLYYF